MGSIAYNREHTNTYLFRFNRKTDRDIIERLGHVCNKTAYIKRLIREDMLRSADRADNGAAADAAKDAP